MKTLGISPKVWAPVALQLLALAATWIASGAFDRVQLAQALTAAGTAVIGCLAGPGTVVGEQDIGPANDELLSPEHKVK